MLVVEFATCNRTHTTKSRKHSQHGWARKTNTMRLVYCYGLVLTAALLVQDTMAWGGGRGGGGGA